MIEEAIREEEIDWSEVAKRLTLYAWRRLERLGMGRCDLAEDFAFEAIRRHLDEQYVDWDRERYPTLLEFLGSQVNGLIRNHLRKFSTNREVSGELDSYTIQQRMRTAPSQHRMIEKREETARVIGILRERVSQDATLGALLDVMLDGIDKPAEQAQALSLPVAEIYKANRRLKRHFSAVRDTIAQANLS